jgi:hypothetical protein
MINYFALDKRLTINIQTAVSDNLVVCIVDLWYILNNEYLLFILTFILLQGFQEKTQNSKIVFVYSSEMIHFQKNSAEVGYFMLAQDSGLQLK